MCIQDFGIGSVIRVYVDNHCQGKPLKFEGVLKEVSCNSIVIQKQDTVYCPNGSGYFLAMVTIDSLSSSSTMIFTKSILACEYISFYSLIGEENRNKFIVQYEEYIDDVVESLRKAGRNPRELHFFTEGGFCIKGK